MMSRRKLLTWSLILIAIAVAAVLYTQLMTAITSLDRTRFESSGYGPLRRAYDSAVAYGVEHGQFPQTTPETGLIGACESGFKRDARPQDWDHPTWRALDVGIEGPAFHTFRFISEGTEIGASFTVTATGDLDCDGRAATFIRGGEIVEQSSDGWGVSAVGAGVRHEGAEY